MTDPQDVYLCPRATRPMPRAALVLVLVLVLSLPLAYAISTL
jgi:hypothetical protein